MEAALCAAGSHPVSLRAPSLCGMKLTLWQMGEAEERDVD